MFSGPGPVSVRCQCGDDCRSSDTNRRTRPSRTKVRLLRVPSLRHCRRVFSAQVHTVLTHRERLTMSTTASAAAVAEMVETGAFGPDSRFVSFALDGQHTEQDQFASSILYGTVAVRDRDCHRQSHRLVFKFKHPEPEMRAILKNDKQFHNEILFYEQIAPFLLACCSQGDGDDPTTPSLCRYFYGRNDCGDLVPRDMIVLENASDSGYRPAITEHRLCLDFEHLIVAFRSLAKFHSLSYRAKHLDRIKFMDLMAKVKDTHWNDDGQWLMLDGQIEDLFSLSLDTLKVRRGNGGEDDPRAQRFRTDLLADMRKTLRRVMEPTEPLSVLCHGDFNRNNLLFRYDEGGRPVDALAYDMATVRYGSPALDLSFFLYMNTDRRTRDDHWDALLDAYCETLATAAGDIPVPDRGRLDNEMREHSFYGLAHGSFFLRIMLEEEKPVDPSQFIKMTHDEMMKALQSFGGDLATEWVADIVQHYLDTYVKT